MKDRLQHNSYVIQLTQDLFCLLQCVMMVKPGLNMKYTHCLWRMKAKQNIVLMENGEYFAVMG